MDDWQKVLDFWFADDTRPLWFAPTPDFDQAIRERFGETLARAAAGELKSWEDSPEGCVALCLLLDQMPRHIFRGTPRAFATDHKAVGVAERAISRAFDSRLPPEYRGFLYMPFMHSERLADQLRAVALFESAGLREARLRQGPPLDRPTLRALSPPQRNPRPNQYRGGAGISGAARRPLWSACREGP